MSLASWLGLRGWRLRLVRIENEPLVLRATAAVLSAYDGSRRHWKPDEAEHLWKICLNKRAGVVGVEVGGDRCCVKLYYDDRPRTRLRTLLGRTRALRAYQNGLVLRRCGIRCPHVIGQAEARPWGPSLIVTELVEGAVPVNRFLAEHGPNGELVRQFAAFVRKMHDAGVAHTDLQLRNVLVRPRGRAEGAGVGTGGYEFLLVDLEDVRVHRRVSDRLRMANLHRMNKWALATVPLKWRLRFLKHYLRGGRARSWARRLKRLVFKHPAEDRAITIRSQAHLTERLRQAASDEGRQFSSGSAATVREVALAEGRNS